MEKQNLSESIIKLVQNERELLIIAMTELVENRIDNAQFKAKLNLMFNNTNSMIENRINETIKQGQ